MTEPVMLTDETGFSYERRAIQKWLRNNNASPITGSALESKTLVPNNALRSLIVKMQKLGRQ